MFPTLGGGQVMTTVRSIREGVAFCKTKELPLERRALFPATEIDQKSVSTCKENRGLKMAE